MDESKNSCKMFDIFIIEDDEGTGRLMQKELIRHGYEVSLAETGKQALDLIKGTKNEILLVDYKLPDMKGKQLIQKLRKKYGYSPNFVTLTGFGNEKIAVEMMKMGSRDYIVKDPEFLEILPVALKRICKELANEIKLEKTELQLKKNIGLLKETNDMARVGGWEIDLDTQKVYWTDTTKKIHEVTDDYTPDLSTAIDFFPAGARRKINNAIKQAMKNGKSYTLELPFVTAKGNKLWVVANGNPQMENGKCVRLKGTIQDITERKKNEEHLKQLNKELTEKERKNRKLAFELEERLKELRCLYSISSIIEKPDISLEEILQESVKFIPHGMQFPDKTCARVIYKNKEFKTTPFRETKIKISQQLLKKMPGQGVVEVYLNDEEKDKETFSFLKEEKELLFLVADRLGKVTDRYETNRQLKASEQQLKASNQQLEAFNQQLISGEQQLRAANQQLAANEQQLMAANQQLAANEEELKKSNEILKKYLDVAAEIVISLDENGNIKLLNESGHRICGYAPGELTGKNWFSTCLPEEDREDVKDFFVELKNNKKGGSSTYENEIITKSGERKI
ncbi:MAG: PAS domain S-box protein, partial [Tangfeifania sp.]